MIWINTIDPSNSWTDNSHISFRHTYGAEYNKITRIRMGDYVKIGGLCFGRITDPTNSWTDN